jgi:hypothetical protein
MDKNKSSKALFATVKRAAIPAAAAPNFPAVKKSPNLVNLSPLCPKASTPFLAYSNCFFIFSPNDKPIQSPQIYFTLDGNFLLTFRQKLSIIKYILNWRS